MGDNLCGNGLARDADGAVFALNRVDAIAGKPAPTGQKQATTTKTAGKTACGYAPLAPFIEKAERRGYQARAAWRLPL
jgi:hypothetical protein